MAGAPAHINTRLTTGPDVGFTDRVTAVIGAVSATTTYIWPVGGGDWFVESLEIVVDTAHLADASNIWTFDIKEYKAGVIGDSLFSSAQSTVTGGKPGALAAFVPQTLSCDQNQTVTSGNSLALILTRGASGVALSGLSVAVVFRRQL